jgi:phosphatidylserine/phosphatidylglycerophosphate/cardiolipin synthase-like enzyme
VTYGSSPTDRRRAISSARRSPIYPIPPATSTSLSHFFAEAQVVADLAKNGCHVKLVVRLGFPTSAYALRQLLDSQPDSVQIRFFTGSAFHPKLYLFGTRAALVGSANLTSAAINTNQEVMV